jgi:GNAT superfamily N-acetyltransferase
MPDQPFLILEIDEQHALWGQLLAMAAALGEAETTRLTLQGEHFKASQVLAAFAGDQPAGYLRFITQRLGEDENRPLVAFNGQVLVEAKIIGFAVLPEYRNRGLGRALQREAIRRAREAGCYQIRSRSHARHAANHHLKIALGFAIQPSLEDDSVYFVMKL